MPITVSIVEDNDQLRGLFKVDGLEFRNLSGRSHGRMRDLLHERLRGQRGAAALEDRLCSEAILELRNFLRRPGVDSVEDCGAQRL